MVSVTERGREREREKEGERAAPATTFSSPDVSARGDPTFSNIRSGSKV